MAGGCIERFVRFISTRTLRPEGCCFRCLLKILKMKQQTALVFLLLFSYVLQIDYLVYSDTESSINLTVVDRFFRAPKTQVCTSGEDSLNTSKCFNSSLTENDAVVTIALSNEEQVTTDLYR